MILKVFALSAVALVIGAYVEGARAGQFFVCDDGRTVEVEFADLEHAKKTNSCVAKYFKPKSRQKPPQQVAAREQKPARQMVVADDNIELPVRKPELVQLRKQQTDEAPSKPLAGRQMADADSGIGRVRIINARPGARQWFKP